MNVTVWLLLFCFSIIFIFSHTFFCQVALIIIGLLTLSLFSSGLITPHGLFNAIIIAHIRTSRTLLHRIVHPTSYKFYFSSDVTYITCERYITLWQLTLAFTKFLTKLLIIPWNNSLSENFWSPIQLSHDHDVLNNKHCRNFI